MQARIGKVAEDGQTTVLPWKDVLDFKRSGMDPGRHSAVLASVSGAPADLSL
jgi:hypothetical protein